ncbi:MAG: sulfur carrier protein ThiS [Pelagibacteraceae bacterium]|jgi:sulfur carrier protein
MIKIQLNGEIQELSKRHNIDELLKIFSIDPNKVAVELNRTVVSKDKYITTYVSNQDVVEIVTFIGGG